MVLLIILIKSINNESENKVNKQTRLRAQFLSHGLCLAQGFLVSGHRDSGLTMVAEFSGSEVG